MNWEVRAVEYQRKLGGKPRRRKHYRCGACRGRASLARELWLYTRPPACKSCGVVDWRLDMHRTKELTTRTGVYNVCHCPGLTHPHRAGSSVWCELHETGPSEDDYVSRYGR